jgi:hypothetical protein
MDRLLSETVSESGRACCKNYFELSECNTKLKGKT